MRIIVANYRYFIAGGPEKYMFKFMEAAQKMGVVLEPGGIDHLESDRNSQFELNRNSQCTLAN